MPNPMERAMAPFDAKMREWQADMLRLRRACGCREAMAAMLLASIGAVWFVHSDGSANLALTIGGAAFGGAVIGKIAGLVVARVRRHVLLGKIERAKREQAPEETNETRLTSGRNSPAVSLR